MAGTKKRILIVEDDAELREAMLAQLDLHDEFAASGVDCARQALQDAEAERIDLMVLDVGLPDLDGREACRLMRRQGFTSPIIMLTGQASDADVILGLEAGANDYVTKPFRFAVLLARIRAQMRQHELSDDAVFGVGPYSFRPSQKLLVSEGGRRKVHLTDKEASILKFLYRKGGRAISRDTLLREVWGYNPDVTTHTLETHIYRLRQKLEPDPVRPEVLVTERGGYRLVPTVEPVC